MYSICVGVCDIANANGNLAVVPNIKWGSTNANIKPNTNAMCEWDFTLSIVP